MGLNKQLSTDYGVDAQYWNIGARTEDFRNGGVEVILYGYPSKAARTAKKQPIAVRKLVISGNDYAPEDTRADLYAKVKIAQNSEFSDAADDAG